MKIILQQVPGFRERWQAHREYWEGEDAGLCNDMSEFSEYVVDLIADEQSADLPMIFELIERLMVKGDQDVQNAAATCFLENLINIAGTDRLDAKKYIHLLGPESRAYCKAWDKFTGVYTEGLW